MSGRNIETVVSEHTEQLMSLPGVVGVAQGLCESQPCILVYISEKTAGLSQAIPASLCGFQVKIRQTGPIGALPKKRRL